MAIDTFQNNLTDEVIKNSVKRLPPEIYPLDAETITQKLKARRNSLKTEGLKYYNFLSKQVKIIGSNDDEYFNVKNSNDLLEVTVYKRKKNGDSAVLYNRYFDQKITKEISLYGLNGNDKFNINPGTKSKIRIRMIGGGGNDTFNIQGSVRNYIYDQSTQKNAILNSSKSKILLSSDPQINEYKITEFNYNRYRFPQINVGYNAEDKLLVGLGFSATTYGFRKLPATEQKFRAGMSSTKP